MRSPKILFGSIEAEIISPDISKLLSLLTAEGIVLKYIKHCDELTVRITVNTKSYQTLNRIADKQGAVVRKVGFGGISFAAKRLLKRPVLMLFLAVVCVMTCYVPGRIFFISVEGNEQVPERYIIEIAAECGIGFGANRRLVRSEIMKNKLLEKIPQLQWAGINTYGCTAVISVREKTLSEKYDEPEYQVSSIVASRDGVIQSCTVFQGNALCFVGQAVKSGQTLVSGYLDCGIVIKTARADAEIRALTSRDLEVISPACTAIKKETQNIKTQYGLKIGKNLIKFYKDSGNLDTTCGKIYSEEYLYLPGGFRLPIAIVKETEIHYDTDEDTLPDTDSGEWLKEISSAYLKNTMVSGEIIFADAEVTFDDAYSLRGRYTCSEMIGQEKREETIPKDDEK